MKILFLSEFYPPSGRGGAPLSTKKLVQGLSERGHECIVLTSEYPKNEVSKIGKNVKIYRKLKSREEVDHFFAGLKSKKNLNDSVKRILPSILEREDIDLIHSHVGCIYTLKDFETEVPVIARVSGYRNVCPKSDLFFKEKEECRKCYFSKYLRCIKGSEYLTRHVKLKKWMKYNPLFLVGLYKFHLARKKALEEIDHIIVPSTFVKNVLRMNSIQKEKISLIPNLPRIKNVVSKPETTLPEDTTTIFCPTGLSYEKGVDLLIRSLQYVNTNKFRTIITGTGVEERKLKFMKRKLNLEDQIQFTGMLKRSEINWYYKNCDLVCMFPKWPEPLSRILLEATYFGKPLIATNVGGNPDGVIHGLNGYLVPKDPQKIAKRINQLAEEEKLRKEMGKESKKIFEQKFQDERTLMKIEKLMVHLMKTG